MIQINLASTCCVINCALVSSSVLIVLALLLMQFSVVFTEKRDYHGLQNVFLLHIILIELDFPRLVDKTILRGELRLNQLTSKV